VIDLDRGTQRNGPWKARMLPTTSHPKYAIHYALHFGNWRQLRIIYYSPTYT